MFHYVMLEHQVKQRQEERLHEAANHRLLRVASRPVEATLARISHLVDRQTATEHDYGAPENERVIPA